MHPSAHIVLSGIEACRRVLRQHPGRPVKAVNRRFDYADSADQPLRLPADRGAEHRWVELRPHTAGIAIQLVDGPRRALAGSVLYPAAAEPAESAGPADATNGAQSGAAGGEDPWLGIDPGAITAPPFLTTLAAAAARALEQLDSFPETLHG